jgi:hypothetical protein
VGRATHAITYAKRTLPFSAVSKPGRPRGVAVGGPGNVAAATAGFQPGIYPNPQPPPRLSRPFALFQITAGTRRVTITFGVVNAPCYGPITRRHESADIGAGGPFSAPIDRGGRFKIHINESHGGERGTFNGRLHGTTASGVESLEVRFFGVIGVPNPKASDSCGVKNLAWSASRQ